MVRASASVSPDHCGWAIATKAPAATARAAISGPLSCPATGTKFGLFDASGERIANYRAPNYGGEVLLGREYGNFGAATFGLRRRSGDIRLDLGAE